MAKKQQPKLSYRPNTGLIAGEAQVAASEAGLSNVGGAFAAGFGAMFAAIRQEEKEIEAKLDAYNSSVPSLQQALFMDNAKNKQIVRSFLNKQRDKYNDLAKTFIETKVREVFDKMEAIKLSIANLDDQIKVFNQDKIEFLQASDDGQLAPGDSYEKDFFTSIYTDNLDFVITDRGDISFKSGGKRNTSKLYKDHASNWVGLPNISQAHTLKLYGDALTLGEKGGTFYRQPIYNSINENLKQGGIEYLQALASIDLTGDTRDGQEINMSFKEQWASGLLDEKFYEKRGKNRGQLKKGEVNEFEWMFDNKNAGELRDLMSTYYTDVMEDGYIEGRKNYTPEEGRGSQGRDTYYIAKQYVDKSAIDPDVKILNSDVQNIKPRIAYNDLMFRRVNGQYEIYDINLEMEDGTFGGFKPVTKEELRLSLRFDEKVGYIIGDDDGGDTDPDFSPVIYQHGGDENKMYNVETKVGNNQVPLNELFSNENTEEEIAEILQQSFPDISIKVPFNINKRITVNSVDINIPKDLGKLIEVLNDPSAQRKIPSAPKKNNTDFNSQK